LRAWKIRRLLKLFPHGIDEPCGELRIGSNERSISNWFVVLAGRRVRVFILREGIAPERISHFNPSSGAAGANDCFGRIGFVHNLVPRPIPRIQPSNERFYLSALVCLLNGATAIHEQLTAKISRPP
jgi:hypothetical protein